MLQAILQKIADLKALFAAQQAKIDDLEAKLKDAEAAVAAKDAEYAEIKAKLDEIGAFSPSGN